MTTASRKASTNSRKVAPTMTDANLPTAPTVDFSAAFANAVHAATGTVARAAKPAPRKVTDDDRKLYRALVSVQETTVKNSGADPSKVWVSVELPDSLTPDDAEHTFAIQLSRIRAAAAEEGLKVRRQTSKLVGNAHRMNIRFSQPSES